ncbi:neocarzinostatin apoprotein domain-containing protein [uncultured Corynebacterium sp.]|uniref:neocarzinostatin apoprotein domain-containing protein n=1 Tax=uncultured Corynebacterium sp. TaxID=159447 RepID=UPI0025E12518|nr:neocarzinostatin apoprotein domain-containing protein [uncultured Corynebacterium sp.]
MKHNAHSTRPALAMGMRVGALVVTLGCALGVTACSNGNDSNNSSSSAASAAKSSGQSANSSDTENNDADSNSDDGASTEVTGTDDIVVMKVSQAKDLKDGQQVTVDVKDADPDMGYYLALCAKEQTGDVPDCLGAHGDPNTQKWISNENEDGAIPDDGSFSEEITVNQKNVSTGGDEIDCKTQECVIKLFGDHSNGFVDVADIPVTFQ